MPSVQGQIKGGSLRVIGPKNMNPATVKRAHDAVVAAFKDPSVMEAMAKQGNTINVSTPEQAQ